MILLTANCTFILFVKIILYMIFFKMYDFVEILHALVKNLNMNCSGGTMIGYSRLIAIIS